MTLVLEAVELVFWSESSALLSIVGITMGLIVAAAYGIVYSMIAYPRDATQQTN